MLFSVVILIGAFLLFQVQPLIAKLILPLFGGGAAIWTACLLFFQAFLLLGYLYAHLLTKLKSLKQQIIVHLFLLTLSLFFLPLSLTPVAFDTIKEAPLSHILMLLMGTVGLPYFLLSSTGPLVQRWLSYVHVNKLPYKLYSLSNTASLLALISYPFIFEPQFVLSSQVLFWSLGYVGFVLVFAGLSFFMLRQKPLSVFLSNSDSLSSPSELNVEQSNKTSVVLWLLLSAVGVVLLVATTNAMTQNIPPMPFLWVLPLCIYLLTFIISFHNPKWYVRWYWLALFIISSFAAILMYFIGSNFDIISQVMIYSLILFSACMLCHGELAKLKPAVEQLTLYYLIMALGGFLGSAFVAFVAQKVFSQFLEFPLAIFAVYVLFLACLLTNTGSNAGKSTIKLLKQSKLFVITSVVSLFVLVLFFVYLNGLFAKSNVTSSRNFYGILSVKDVKLNGVVERRLIDGSTSHGTQILSTEADNTPRSYYRKNTGIALTLTHFKESENMTVGIIGLGAGTLAAYGKKGDVYDFYELNPNVEKMANEYFSYLSSSKAETSVVIGDGRVSLDQALTKNTLFNYDVLVLDAFSGDSIPSHLLTKEAFMVYFQQLSDHGVLAVHISNSHLDLTPLIRGLAGFFNKNSLYIKTKEQQAGENNAEWVLISNNQHFLNQPKVRQFVSPWPKNASENIVWTDNYSNLLSVLK